MKLTQQSVSDLLAAFRSQDPTPGGGSASALAGAMGASLLAMVASLPKSRATTEEDVERLAAAGRRSTEICEQLTSLTDKDSEAYDLVMAAYKFPKGTDEEKAARTAKIQDALRVATETPLTVMRACLDALEQGAVVGAFGNRNASSDVLVGVELLRAGLRGAKLNVEINLGSLKDEAYVAGVRKEIARLEAEANAAADAVSASMT